jgi:glycosyltransferase involved in cell wall biosynthesis
MRSARIGVVIPALNEAESIGAVLSEVPWDDVDDVFVVCGDSTDETPAIATAYGAHALTQIRHGYGAACNSGAHAAIAQGADVLVFLDGDGSDPPERIPDLVLPVAHNKADLVLGLRALGRQREALPLHARLGNRLVVTALGALLRRRLRDLPSFKAIRASTLELLELKEQTYGWTIELIAKAIASNCRVVEVEVGHRARLGGRSKVSGTVRGTIGAAWKLGAGAVRYGRWRPTPTLAPNTSVAELSMLPSSTTHNRNRVQRTPSPPFSRGGSGGFSKQ